MFEVDNESRVMLEQEQRHGAIEDGSVLVLGIPVSRTKQFTEVVVAPRNFGP